MTYLDEFSCCWTHASARIAERAQCIGGPLIQGMLEGHWRDGWFRSLDRR